MTNLNYAVQLITTFGVSENSGLTNGKVYDIVSFDQNDMPQIESDSGELISLKANDQGDLDFIFESTQDDFSSRFKLLDSQHDVQENIDILIGLCGHSSVIKASRSACSVLMDNDIDDFIPRSMATPARLIPGIYRVQVVLHDQSFKSRQLTVKNLNKVKALNEIAGLAL